MTDRKCKFCGEAGHNIRSCAEVKKAKAFTSRLSDILAGEGPKIVEKHLPSSSFAGSMISNKLKLNESDKPLAGAGSTPYTAAGIIGYHRWNKATRALEPEIAKYSSEASNDAHRFMNCLAARSAPGAFQEISYFVSGENFQRPGNWGNCAQRDLLRNVSFDLAPFIQAKLEESGDNVYKKIWNNICITCHLKDRYSNYEGKEGIIVLSFLEGAFRDLEGSARTKRTDIDKLFWTISGQLSQNSRRTILNEFSRVEGEWMNTAPPEFLFEWDSSKAPDITNPAILENTSLKEQAETLMKAALEETTFEAAKQVFSDYYDRVSYSQLQKLMQPEAILEDSVLFETSAYDGGAIKCNEPPQDVLDWVSGALTFNERSTNASIKEFIKMAHSGGYNQKYTKGKLYNQENYFQGVRVDEGLGILLAGTNEPAWSICGDWQFRIDTNKLQEVSLSDIVNAALEALCNAEREIL